MVHYSLPQLAIVTGRPGSGKSTLARDLAERLGRVLLSRDEVKEEMIRTLAGDDASPPHSASSHIQLQATDAFFSAIESLVGNGVSLVAEAAFQHKVWSSRLEPFLDVADVRIVVCEVPYETALARAQKRVELDPERERSHPMQDIREEYEPPRFNVPTLVVDTTRSPDFESILKFLD